LPTPYCGKIFLNQSKDVLDLCGMEELSAFIVQL
jgi:hypothetical protein